MSASLVPTAKLSSPDPHTEHDLYCVPWIARKVQQTFPGSRIFLDRVADSHPYFYYCPKHNLELAVYIVKPYYEIET